MDRAVRELGVGVGVAALRAAGSGLHILAPLLLSGLPCLLLPPQRRHSAWLGPGL